MNFMKRAILYPIRKKGRMLLMLCLLFLMSLSILIGISFKKSTEKELNSLQKKMASGFFLKADTDNEMYREAGAYGNVYAGPRITEEMIGRILSLDGVKDYTVESMYMLTWTDLNLRPGMFASWEPDPNPDMNAPEQYTEEYLMLCRHSTYMYPCRNGDLYKNFRTGALSITEGRNIEAGDYGKAVISDWLANENHLSVGDTITLGAKEGNYRPSSEPLKTWGSPVEAEIVGLFHSNFSQEFSDFTIECCYIENIIYTDTDTFKKMKENLTGQAGYEDALEYISQYVDVGFLVEDPMQIDSIIQQIKALPDLDLTNMKLEIDDSAYQALAKPYRQIRVFAMLLLTMGLCGMGIILYLILKLWMQGREREIGILYSVGIKKREILCQMLTECLLVSAAALATVLLLSGPAVGQCANVLECLAASGQDAQEYEVKISESFTPEIIKTSSAEAVLERTVSGDTMFVVILFVFGISSVSVILSFISISHFEPKKLLQSM